MKKPITESELRKNPIQEFTCCNKTMNLDEFKNHVSEVHGIDIADKNMKMTMQMLSHIDGDFWYSYTYQCEFENGIKFIRYTMNARSKNDPMRFN